MLKLDLSRRFLFALLPVVLAAPLLVGALAHHQMEREFEERVELDLPRLLRANSAATLQSLRGLERELDELLLTANIPEDGDIQKFFRRQPAVAEIQWIPSALNGGEAIAWNPTSGRATLRAPVGSAGLTSKGFRTQCLHERGNLWLVRSGPDPDAPRMAIAISDALIEAAFSPLRGPHSAYPILTDRQGTVLASTAPGFHPGVHISEGDAPCAEHLAEALLTADGSVHRCGHGADSWLLARTYDPKLGLRIGYALPRAEMRAGILVYDRKFWAVSLLAGLLAAFFIRLLMRRVIRPLREFSFTMREVADGELSRRLPVDGDDEIAVLARSFNRMVSDLHTSQEALRQQSQRLAVALREVESVESMKDSFLALVSHEVRTPLTSIMGGVEFLRDDSFGERDPIEVEFHEIIYQSCQRLHGFMNDAMLMASLQGNRSRSEFDETSLSGLLHAKLNELKSQIHEKAITVDDGLRSENEILMRGDWTLLSVALEKILHNAVRHNHMGGRVQLDLVDRVLEDDQGLLSILQAARGIALPRPGLQWRALRIFNTGPVIPDDRRRALFQRFELAHDIANHQRGSGLSLPIASYVMELHHGHIEVRASGEDGMVFYLIFPIWQADAPAELPDAPFDGMDATVATAVLATASESALQSAPES